MFSNLFRIARFRTIPFWIISIVIGGSFILIQLNWDISTAHYFQASVNQQANIVAAGNWTHAAGYALVGLFGAWLLISRWGLRRQYCLIPTLFFLGYLSICFASLLWSAEPALSARRMMILLFCLAGVFGVERHLNGHELIRSVVIMTSMFIFVGLAAELNHGTFQPWRCGCRFAGTMHPNLQGMVCATLVLASYIGFREDRPGKRFYLLTIALGFSFLYLTRSRTSIAGCCSALYLTSFWASSVQIKRLLLLTPLLSAGGCLLTALLLDMDIMEGLRRIINYGQCPDIMNTASGSVTAEVSADSSEEMASLTGRLPLWQLLKDDILNSPALGHGYHGFWTPEVIKTISNKVGWTVAHGHSVVVDLLLNVGIVGTLLYICTALSVLIKIIRRCMRNIGPIPLFAFAMAVFSMLAGLMESAVMEPKYFTAFVTSVLFLKMCVRQKGDNQWL